MGLWIKGLTRQKKIEFSVLIIVFVVLYIVPFLSGTTDNAMRIAFNIALYAVFAMMWNMMCGYAGLLSLGQQVFIGISGYTTAVICTSYGLPFIVAIFASGVISALFALFLSVLLLRMRGLYFAIATWVVAEMMKILFKGWGFVNFSGGMTISVSPYPTFGQQFLMVLSLVVGSFILVYVILNSRIGLGLTAMRDDIDAAEGLGVSIFKNKTFCFTFCAFITGMAGSLAYLNKLSLFPDGAFSINWTIAIVFAVIIGGIGTATGPFVGAAVYVILVNVLARYAGYSNIILGVIAIVVIIAAPKGIVGTLQEKLNFEILSSRRPSLE